MTCAYWRYVVDWSCAPFRKRHYMVELNFFGISNIVSIHKAFASVGRKDGLFLNIAYLSFFQAGFSLAHVQTNSWGLVQPMFYFKFSSSWLLFLFLLILEDYTPTGCSRRLKIALVAESMSLPRALQLTVHKIASCIHIISQVDGLGACGPEPTSLYPGRTLDNFSVPPVSSCLVSKLTQFHQ